jgi:predicted dehydrogenase
MKSDRAEIGNNAGGDATASASRRDFLKGATAVTTGILATGGLGSHAGATSGSMPTTAAAMRRVLGANDRLHVGHIGPHQGGQGGAHTRNLLKHKEDWNIEYVAVCDIYGNHLDEAAQATGLSDSQKYVDYRKMLEKAKEIDVVWVTTPEHWHAAHTMAALEAGKDVYCEKPLCKGVEEALKVRETVLRTKRVIQIGSQGCSDPTYHRIAEILNSGKYGPVVWAQGSYCRNSKEGEWNYYGLDADATPQNTHWDVFEQPCATKHAFDKQRFFRWRKFWDYSAGIQGDLFPHVLHPFLLAIGKPEWPRRVVALGDLLLQKDREVPDTVHMIVEYPSGYTVVIAGSTTNESGLTPTIRTNKATIEFAMFGGGQVHVMPQAAYADEVDEINEHVPGAGESIETHEDNFLQCVRDRTKTPNCNIDLATKVQVAISMGEMAFRQQKEVRFDVEKLRLI